MFRGGAALAVDQELVEGKAEAADQRADAVDADRTVVECARAGGLRRQVGEAERGFEAQHPRAGLIVDAKLAATERTATRDRADERREHAGAASPGVASRTARQMAARIDAGP